MLDLFCKAGGCTRGYQLAGFYVVGVDIEPQPRYVGDRFVRADALKYVAEHGYKFDAIHASPECQGYSVTQAIWGKEYRRQIDAVRAALQATGKLYVIENVIGAPLENPVMLCGSMFGLRVYRHRLFEISPFLLAPPHTPHRDKTPRAGRGISPKGFISVAGHMGHTDYAREAMGIDWMIGAELSQAIPPAYTEWIGRHLMEHLAVTA